MNICSNHIHLYDEGNVHEDIAMDVLSTKTIKDHGQSPIHSAKTLKKSNRKAMNRNWSNQKAHPALKTKTGNK